MPPAPLFVPTQVFGNHPTTSVFISAFAYIPLNVGFGKTAHGLLRSSNSNPGGAVAFNGRQDETSSSETLRLPVERPPSERKTAAFSSAQYLRFGVG